MSEIKTNKLSSLTGTNNDITIDPDGTGNTVIASGNVGIGTSSPSETLHVEEATTGNAVRVSRGGNYIIMGGSGSGTQYVKGYEGTIAFGNAFAGNTTFLTNDTERMRIDSSGNLLVATTSLVVANSASNNGYVFNTNGELEIGSTSRCLTANRQGSDGDAIRFQKDGTTVGSIGAVAGKIYIGSSAGGDTFLRLNSNTVTPANSSGADRDDAINLGYSSSRFKDLYLSGQATVGTAVASSQTASVTGSTTLDFGTYQNFILTLTGNITLANPTTEQAGQTGFIIFIHSGAARTVSLGTDYETAGAAGLTLSGTAGAVDIVPYVVQSAGNILLGAPQLAFS